MSLEVISLEIPDVKLITPRKHGDARGFFSETYNKTTFAAHGISLDFVQDNQSFSAQRGTLRGLHYQSPPFAQDKLVRVVRGRILDVAVDIRRNSPTFGKWVAAEISAEKWNQILVPAGFAHGICTLEPDTELLYKVTNFYSAQHDFGIRWNDPDLGIDWPFGESDMMLSDKDKNQPFLKDVTTPF
ncbi:MAG: dTDP-4-dehydrorhamnose 3,5-epimerase [Bradyrhizobium sp.]|nr:dTDP-4-dehydrorhamnose 3,5-epimerase [Bradyrhizobium sp.]